VLPALLAAQYADKALVLRPLRAPITHRFVVGCALSLKESVLVERFAKAARAVAEALVSRGP
jgi:hypothetical protein